MNCENNTSCAPEEFSCGQLCVASAFLCDGRQDCVDGTDEQQCGECREGLFQCSGTCLPLHLRCDGEYHCPDGEDEANCTDGSGECPADHLTCYSWFSYYCLHPAFFCDGRKDCTFGYDEQDCGECGEGLFHCKDDTCVPLHQRCDGTHHCPDGEDERECERCLGGSHHCAAEGVCLPASKLCDGLQDCRDGSDEICGDCLVNYSVVCGEGHCLHNIHLCDAHRDCGNGKDEQGCESCAEGRVLCPGGDSCIYSFQLCDGKVDCLNGTDEHECGLCGEDYFVCNDYTCVHQTFRCDGIDDCNDAEDEKHCEQCPEGVMRCREGRCIDSTRRCDGFADCDGIEDERNCTGCKLGVLCEGLLSSYCVPLEQMCDGRADCGSGADELLCEEYVENCPGLDFKCDDGTCVAARYRCDGERDCSSGEDEVNCDTCAGGAHYCADDTCIAAHHLCGADCIAPSEEQNCTSAAEECPAGLVWCGTGNCINPRFLCTEPWSSSPCPDDLRRQYCDDVTSLPVVHNLRSQCSQQYREVVRLRERSVVSPAHPQQDICDDYMETVDWSVICQMGIFCDHYGCYDDHLRSYQESTPRPGLQCSKCGGTTDLCWPSRWADDWRAGRLEQTTLKLMLLRQRADFADLQEVFSTPAADQRLYSLPPESLVYSCSLDNNPCDYRWFFTWPSDTHGMCYTFNARHSDNLTLLRPPATTAHVGPKNGLRLALTVHPGLSLLSPEVGLRVVVHNPYHLPVPDEQGFNVGPGASSVSVSRTINRRLGKPHWLCGEDPPSVPQYSTTVLAPFMLFPLTLRLQVCVEREKRDRCGCGEGASPVHDELPPPPLGLCSRQNATQKLCMELVQADYLSGLLQCDCPVACRSVD
ncbi:hypothetical protein O3P69_001449 [Scylla paramamosain]|uniref:Uncharacterized protein n=1 Tax=Scylla paramamosain TaxID=85552 RepID=A0AAW0UXM2_SCYPA